MSNTTISEAPNRNLTLSTSLFDSHFDFVDLVGLKKKKKCWTEAIDKKWPKKNSKAAQLNEVVVNVFSVKAKDSLFPTGQKKTF